MTEKLKYEFVVGHVYYRIQRVMVIRDKTRILPWLVNGSS